MMAAAAPRLRPLLVTLRAQSFRGHLWCYGASPGLSLAVRGLASEGGQPLAAPPLSSPQIPPPTPPTPSQISEGTSQNSLNLGDFSQIGGVEPRLEDLGLGAFTPVGLIQNLLESLHVDLGMPWWGAIAAGTLGVRVLLLPLVLRGQREAARLTQHLPQIQKLNQRLAEAKRGADPNQVARAYTELVSYQQRHDVNPLRGFLVPLVQGMAAVPVPGLLSGGLGWFMDLSSHDPYYVLPVLVTASTWLVLELGAETGVSAPGAGAMRQLLRLLPLFFLPFILHFPTAVFTYWLTSNSFSLLQTLLLRVPALRAKVGMAPPPATATPTPTGFPQKKKEGFLTRLKKEWAEAQATQRAEERQRRLRDHLSLAGKGPLRQTFAQNPLSPPKAPPETPPKKRPWRDTLG